MKNPSHVGNRQAPVRSWILLFLSCRLTPTPARSDDPVSAPVRVVASQATIVQLPNTTRLIQFAVEGHRWTNQPHAAFAKSLAVDHRSYATSSPSFREQTHRLGFAEPPVRTILWPGPVCHCEKPQLHRLPIAEQIRDRRVFFARMVESFGSPCKLEPAIRYQWPKKLWRTLRGEIGIGLTDSTKWQRPCYAKIVDHEVGRDR